MSGNDGRAVSGPRMFQLVGKSGSGKTLTLEKATRLLRRKGLRVAVLKHSHHPMDLPGKDTDRVRRSGANMVLFASDRTVIIGSWDPIRVIHLLPADVVLIEGYHRRRLTDHRFVINSPEDSTRVAKAISASAGPPRKAAQIRVDGRRSPPGEVWSFVGDLMEQTGIRIIERRG